MMHATSPAEFDNHYTAFKTFLLPDYSAFLNYFDKQWLVKKNLWCKAWRLVQYHLILKKLGPWTNLTFLHTMQ